MSPDDISTIVIATGAIGTTSFALVDACKYMGDYGPSSLGYTYIEAVYKEMAPALSKALGEGWEKVLKGYWLNGTSRDRQVSVAMNALRLGLDETTAQSLTAPIDSKTLKAVVKYLNEGALGDTPDTTDQAEVRQKEIHQALNALGRLDAYYRARLDAAFERADHQYRSGSRLLAGIVAVILSVGGGLVFIPGSWNQFWTYALIGVMAVPMAPIAKDLATAIKSVATNLKTITAKV